MNVNQMVKRESVPWLQWMPNWLEVGLIFGITLWPFVYSSVVALLTTLADASIDHSYLSTLLTLEAYSLMLVVPLMVARGWTVESLGLRFRWNDLTTALALLALAYAGYVALWLLFTLVLPDAAGAASHVEFTSSKLNFKTLLAASFMQGFFEELFVVGYLMHCVRPKFGVIAAVNISVLVRLVFHLYQGPVAAIGIIPVGLVFAWAYVRTGRLWPLIIGHMLIDTAALMQIAD